MLLFQNNVCNGSGSFNGTCYTRWFVGVWPSFYVGSLNGLPLFDLISVFLISNGQTLIFEIYCIHFTLISSKSALYHLLSRYCYSHVVIIWDIIWVLEVQVKGLTFIQKRQRTEIGTLVALLSTSFSVSCMSTSFVSTFNILYKKSYIQNLPFARSETITIFVQISKFNPEGTCGPIRLESVSLF